MSGPLFLGLFGTSAPWAQRPDDPRRVIGIVTRSDLLKPRARLAEEEMRRERFLGRGPA
jgi:hypothetical protein